MILETAVQRVEDEQKPDRERHDERRGVSKSDTASREEWLYRQDPAQILHGQLPLMM